MHESMDSGDDRRALRLARRWRRRARIAAPFLVVPAMLGLLVLSVDLIEYRPSPESDDASAPPRSERAVPGASDGPSESMSHAPDAALSVSVVEAPISPSPATNELAAPGPGLPAWMADSVRSTPAH